MEHDIVGKTPRLRSMRWVSDQWPNLPILTDIRHCNLVSLDNTSFQWYHHLIVFLLCPSICLLDLLVNDKYIILRFFNCYIDFKFSIDQVYIEIDLFYPEQNSPWKIGHKLLHLDKCGLYWDIFFATELLHTNYSNLVLHSYLVLKNE